MIDDIPPWLHINIWQWSVHQAEWGIVWTEKMDREVRRYMEGEIGTPAAAKNCGQTRYRVEARAKVLSTEAAELT